jgi:hypothetical protein
METTIRLSKPPLYFIPLFLVISTTIMDTGNSCVAGSSENLRYDNVIEDSTYKLLSNFIIF